MYTENVKKIMGLFVLCTLYDISITYYGINYYGLSEINPLFKDMVYNNFILISFIKMVVMFGCLGVFYKAYKQLNIQNKYIKYLPVIFMMVIQNIFNINNSLLVLGWY